MEGQDPPPPPPPPYQRPDLPFERSASAFARIGAWSAIGFEFAVSVVLFFLGGRWLDANLGTDPWLSVAGAMLGVLVGVYLMVRALLRDLGRRE